MFAAGIMRAKRKHASNSLSAFLTVPFARPPDLGYWQLAIVDSRKRRAGLAPAHVRINHHAQNPLSIQETNQSAVKLNTRTGKRESKTASHRLREGPCQKTGTSVTIIKSEIASQQPFGL